MQVSQPSVAIHQYNGNTLIINTTAESVIIMRDAFSKYLAGDLRDTADKDLTSTGSRDQRSAKKTP